MGGGRYGKSFAQKCIQDGDFEQAIIEADKAMSIDAEDARPHADKGQALHQLARFQESVACLEHAITLNRETASLHDDDLDDLFYESIRAHAAAVHATGDSKGAVSILDAYARVLPRGSHLADREKWYRQFGS